MRGWALGLVACVAVSAQTPRELFIAHCAGCHGRAGEGSRGPALKSSSLADVESLVALLRRGIPGTEMPAIAPATVADEPLRMLAAYVISLRSENRGAATSGLDRGAGLFRGKGKCLGCHRVNGEGSSSGPDLSDIGRSRQPESLRRSVVEPEAELFDSFAGYRWTIWLPDNYLLVEVVTKNGELVTGSRMNEDAFSLQMRDGEGRIRSFLKSEVAEMRKQWGKSPMPSYRNVFSGSELDDLIAYLASLRGLR